MKAQSEETYPRSFSKHRPAAMDLKASVRKCHTTLASSCCLFCQIDDLVELC